MPPAAAEFYFETELDSLILRSKINESSSVSKYYLANSAEKRLFTQPHILLRGCEKKFFMALRAKLNLDGDIFFLILLRKIKKKTSPSKEYFAAAGGKNLLHNPSRYNLARSAIK